MKKSTSATTIFSVWKNMDDKYICIDDRNKCLEIDIDGSCYFHVKFPVIALQYCIIKSVLDSSFNQMDSFNDSKVEEYYYKDDLILLSKDNIEKTFTIEFTHPSKVTDSFKKKKKLRDMVDSFMEWDPSIVTVISLLKTHL